MSKITKLYSVEEASKHNTKPVYNVTKYLDDHPGGVLFLRRDAIEDFDFVGHSKSAREFMETYLIGELDPSSVPQQQDKSYHNHTASNRSSHSKVHTIISFQILAHFSGHSCHFCDSWLSVFPQ
ncbi:hypothetical protein MKW92_025330 [Papaver armeniacum]|nr:hypothetical protein MKW92_025330 [Papaver armeniacum]